MGKDKQIFNRDSNANHKIISEQPRQSTQQNSQEQQAIELINQGDFKQAELVCLRQIKKDNSDHAAHFFLGLSYRKQKKLKLAILAYKAAIKIHPNFFEAYFNLGTVLSEYGKPLIAESDGTLRGATTTKCILCGSNAGGNGQRGRPLRCTGAQRKPRDRMRDRANGWNFAGIGRRTPWSFASQSCRLPTKEDRERRAPSYPIELAPGGSNKA